MNGSQESWRKFGFAILATGLFVAVIIFATAGHPSADDDTLNKREIYEAEKIAGQADVLAIEANAWIASLWHGRRLAVTIAVLSAGAGAFCFWRGDRAPVD